jgi:hypothetical protein
MLNGCRGKKELRRDEGVLVDGVVSGVQSSDSGEGKPLKAGVASTSPPALSGPRCMLPHHPAAQLSTAGIVKCM